MTNETKERIASQFFRYPLVCMLVRTLLYSVPFQLCFLGVLLLPILLALVLTKIWRTTPAGFSPVVRISGVDWLQAKSLARTATQELRAGRSREGILSYSMAVGNNPADAALVRGFLQGILAHAEPPQFQAPALTRAFWLLRLRGTNLVDLELAASVFEKYGLSDYLASLLAPREAALTVALQKTYLRVLFNNGRAENFDRFWKSRMPSDALSNDPELQLYRAAFAAGWGPATDSGLAHDLLKGRLDDPTWRVTVSQLYILVCEKRMEPDRYLAVLDRLREWKKDRLIDHVRAWRLLASHGRRDEAIALAKQYPESPTTGLETVQLVQAYFALDLRDAAKRLLDRFTLEFSFLDGLWVLYGNLLIEAGQWDKLRQLALKIRLNDDVRERLGDLGHYFEGRAELGLSRTTAAARCFQEIGFRDPENPELALAIGESLQRVGYTPVALRLLSRVERQCEKNPAYWDLVAAVAFDLKDVELLLRSTAKSMALNPESWTARNNYAAALVTARREPETAAMETLRLMVERPGIPVIRINHAQALIQNHRYDEADRVLAGIQPSALKESELAVYQFACIETLAGQGRHDFARKFLAQIDPKHLFPGQREHLKRLAEVLRKGEETVVSQP